MFVYIYIHICTYTREYLCVVRVSFLLYIYLGIYIYIYLHAWIGTSVTRCPGENLPRASVAPVLAIGLIFDFGVTILAALRFIIK